MIPGRTSSECKTKYNTYIKTTLIAIKNAESQEIPEEFTEPNSLGTNIVSAKPIIADESLKIILRKLDSSKGSENKLTNSNTRISTQMTKLLSSISSKEIV